RHHDEEHPHHDSEVAARDSSAWSGRPGSTWGDTVHDLYLKMDPVLGRLRERVGEDTAIVVMSDHGFAPYRREFSLNTWLLEKGYLVLKEGQARELPLDDPAHAPVSISSAVDWAKTKAYGVGFNGLYLNLAGRELDNPDTPEDESGCVQPGAEAERLLTKIKQDLEAEVDPKTGLRCVLRADLASAVYSGERMAESPDIIVGYDSGYGNSDASTSGRIPHNILQDNLGGTFNGSHLMAPDVVAGVMLSNLPVLDGAHALEDLTVEILRQYDIKPVAGMNGHAVFH
ncbi:MAG: alkaline phosphatase family protein, partial [Planctomycetota bacterium]|nr:alkaline phosphatase family protein [Planctomycetota bacterium]